MSAAANDSAVNVRPYRPGDEEGMLRVLQSAFERWPEIETNVAPIDHLRWKLAGAPEPAEAHTVAEIDGQIVGARIGLIQEYHVHGRVLRRGMETDAATLPAFRGRGIYSKISRFRLEEPGRDFMLSSTGRASLTQADRQIGHQPIGNRIISLTCRLSDARDGETVRSEVVKLSAFDTRIERFWALAGDAFEFIAMPSQAQLNWRYCDVRGGRGFVLYLQEERGVAGLIVGRMSRGRGYIAYLLTLPGRIDVLRDLIRAALSHFGARGIAEVKCALPTHHPYGAPLINEGFTEKSHVIPLTWRPIRDGLDLALLNSPRALIHLMLGDTDLI